VSGAGEVEPGLEAGRPRTENQVVVPLGRGRWDMGHRRPRFGLACVTARRPAPAKGAYRRYEPRSWSGRWHDYTAAAQEPVLLLCSRTQYA